MSSPTCDPKTHPSSCACCQWRLEVEIPNLRSRVKELESRNLGDANTCYCGCNAHEQKKIADAIAAQVHAMRIGWVNLVKHWGDIEARSEEAHTTYQEEAHRRGDVRHPDAYADLSEPTKEWDRVLVRWVQRKLEAWHTFDNGDDADAAERRVAAMQRVVEAAKVIGQIVNNHIDEKLGPIDPTQLLALLPALAALGQEGA